MTEKMPRTPLSTSLSGSARETERRLRDLFSGPKKRPPLPVLALMGALCLLCGSLVSCRVAGPEADPSPPPAPEADPSPQPDPMETEEVRLSLQRAAEEKLNGYLWPRESIRQDILGEEMEFVLFHGNGWTMYVPAGWEMDDTGAGRWRSPSKNASFLVYKHFLGVEPQQQYRAQMLERHETDYEPPFDYYYKHGYYEVTEGLPPAGTEYIYFVAPAEKGESYEFILQTLAGETTEAEKRIQEAMLLSFRLDETSLALNCEDYTLGQTQWEVAMAGLMAPTERICFTEGTSIVIDKNGDPNDPNYLEIDGERSPDYLSYALEIGEFRPEEEFVQYFYWERPTETKGSSESEIHVHLPDLGIWLSFYPDTPWMCVCHAGEYYWAQVHDPNAPDKLICDTVRAWLEAERAYAAG